MTSPNWWNEICIPYHGKQEPAYLASAQLPTSASPLSLLYSAPATSLACSTLPWELCMAHSCQSFSPNLSIFSSPGAFSDHPDHSFSLSLPCFIFQSIITFKNYMIHFRVYRFTIYFPHLSPMSSSGQEPRLFLSSPESPSHWMNQTNEVSISHFPRKIYI